MTARKMALVSGAPKPRPPYVCDWVSQSPSDAPSGRVSRGRQAFTVPQWVVYVVIPVGAALLFLQFLANLLGDLRALRSAASAR